MAILLNQRNRHLAIVPQLPKRWQNACLDNFIRYNKSATSANSVCSHDLTPVMEAVPIFSCNLITFWTVPTSLWVCTDIITVIISHFCLFHLFLRFRFYCYIYKFNIMHSVRRVLTPTYAHDKIISYPSTWTQLHVSVINRHPQGDIRQMNIQH